MLAILTVRNEGAFLLDWLAHHRRIGFTDFLVFSNDCQDGTDLMLDRLQQLGWLTHVRNSGPHAEGAQWSALKLAEEHPLRRSADWIMVIDIDEFVQIHCGDGSLDALISALPGASALPLTWRLFGNTGQLRHEDRPVPHIFTRAAPTVMGWPWRAAMFKTLYRNDNCYRKLGVHRPRGLNPGAPTPKWFDGSGRELPQEFHRDRLLSSAGQDNYQLVQLNHYALGTIEDYILKCDRGRANRQADVFDLSYWIERNLCAAEDLSLFTKFDLCKPYKDGLLADAELSRLYLLAKAWRGQRFFELMRQEGYRNLLGRLLMAQPSRILTEAENRFLSALWQSRDVS